VNDDARNKCGADRSSGCPECGATGGLHAISCSNYRHFVGIYKPFFEARGKLSDGELANLRALVPYQWFGWPPDEYDRGLPVVEVRQDQLEALLNDLEEHRNAEASGDRTFESNDEFLAALESLPDMSLDAIAERLRSAASSRVHMAPPEKLQQLLHDARTLLAMINAGRVFDTDLARDPEDPEFRAAYARKLGELKDIERPSDRSLLDTRAHRRLHAALMQNEEYRKEYKRVRLASAFATEVIRFRMEHELTQGDLARALGVDVQAIEKLESGGAPA
jgi:DNA-binding XRE family transcriptional regulator